MALFVVISDFRGAGSLHLKENAVIDEALYDLPGLQAAGLQVVAATPEVLASVAVSAPASTAQVVENAEGGGAVSAALIPLWRNDVVGDPFLDADVVAAPGPLTAATTLFGRRIMLICASGEAITITMPVIADSNKGEIVGVYENSFDKDYGAISLDPAGSDSIAGGPSGTTRTPVLGEMAPWLEMVSDGNDDWLCTVGMNTVGPNAAFNP